MPHLAVAMTAHFGIAKEGISRKTGPPVDLALLRLIERLRLRDTSAFEPFIKKTESLGFRLAYQILGDYHLAQDVLQEAYLVVFRKIHTLKDPGAFRSWFCRIVINLGIDSLRGKIRPVFLDAQDDAELAMLTHEVPFTERTLTMEDLRRALIRLSPRERTALILRDYLGFAYEEMAKTLDIPLGTVKSRLAEARRKLAGILSGKEDGQ